MTTIDPRRAYERAERELYETQLRVISMSHRAQSGVDAKILPSLIAKRDRLIPIVASLKIAADAVTPARGGVRYGDHSITYTPPRTYPAGSLVIAYDAGPIPDFLKRTV